MSMDLSIIGIVFAIILFIIFFSAIVLYLSFRLKETFREEKKRGMLIVKIVFLVGILFLAGASFYFFAQILSPSSPSLTPPSNGTTPLPPSNGNGEQKPELNLLMSYPTEIRINTQFTMTFTISNPSDTIAHDVLIQTNSLFEQFSVVSSTHDLVGNIIEIGDVSPGTIVSSLELLCEDKPGTKSDTITLTFTEATEPITKNVSISVRGGP